MHTATDSPDDTTISPPRISVVIPNYNGMAHLPACLASLQQQDLGDARMEICVVDDASTDHSVAWLASTHPAVRLQQHQQNAGFAATANDGLRMASGEWIFLLNNDTRVAPDCLQKALAYITQHPEATWLACQLRLMQHPACLDSAGDILTIAGFPRARGKYRPAEEFSNSPEQVFSSCGAAVLIRIDMLQRVGMFEESFTSYQEDTDWSFRANLAGYRCTYLPESIVFHRMSATTGSGSPYITYHTSRNIPSMWLRNAPWSILIATLPLHIVASLLQGLLYLKNGTFWHFLRGKGAFLSRIPRLMRERASIQQTRVISVRDLFSRLEWHWFRTLILERLRTHPLPTYTETSAGEHSDNTAEKP